jgi:hypothetical protein
MATEMETLQRFEEAAAGGVEVLGASRPGGRRLAETRDFLAFLRAEMTAALARWPAERDRRAAARDG